jgi:hypothetical protein
MDFVGLRTFEDESRGGIYIITNVQPVSRCWRDPPGSCDQILVRVLNTIVKENNSF